MSKSLKISLTVLILLCFSISVRTSAQEAGSSVSESQVKTEADNQLEANNKPLTLSSSNTLYVETGSTGHETFIVGEIKTIPQHIYWTVPGEVFGYFLVGYVRIEFDENVCEPTTVTSGGLFSTSISARGLGYVVVSLWYWFWDGNPINDPDRVAFSVNWRGKQDGSTSLNYFITDSGGNYRGYFLTGTVHNMQRVTAVMEYQSAVSEPDIEIEADQNPPKNNDNTDCDPIWTQSGEFFQSVTDLTIPGRGFPFRFTRTYRSQIGFNGPLGHGWDFNYNERLVEKPDENKVLYFNGQARRDEFMKQPDDSYTAPVGFYVVLAKQIDGTFTLQERDGTVKIFTSNPFSPGLYTLSSITDRNNNQMAFQYKPTGQLDQITDTLGRVIKVNWGDNGRISELEDFNEPIHRKIKYTIDDKFDLVAVTSPTTDDYPDGKTTRYTYSSDFEDEKLNHNLIDITDPKQQTYLSNQYNEEDKIEIQFYGEGGFKVGYEEMPDGTFMTIVIDRNDNKRICFHNALGNAIQKEVYTSNGVITTRWEYNADGERTRTVFPEGNSIEYKFGGISRLSQGNLLEVRRKSHLGEPDIFTSFTYEPLYNQVDTSTDARGNTTTFYFDSNGNVNRILYPTVTLPDGSQQIIEAIFQYNNYGQVIRAIDPEGIITKYEYYTSGSSTGYLYRVIRDWGGLNITSAFEYDLVGNITGIYDAKGNKTAFSVNELNQVIETISRSPFGYRVRFKYDADDNLEQIETENRDENGILDPVLPWINTAYGYDILDNLATKTEQVSATESAITQYLRDANENLTDTTQPEGNIRKTIYDELNRVYQSIEGFGSATPLVSRNFYDDNSNLIRTEIGDGAKGTTTHQYDGFDRRIRTTDALGNYSVTDYDNNSNVTRIASYNNANQKLSEVLYFYDQLNRLYRTIEKKFATTDYTDVTDVITTYWHDKKGRRWKTRDIIKSCGWIKMSVS